MIELPRIALGSVQPHLDLQDILWALLEGLRRVKIAGQVFCSQSRFDDQGSLTTIDERRLRHLDSWLMAPEVSRWFLLEGGQERDLSIIVGRYGQPEQSLHQGGSLNQLCRTLQLPSLVVLDVSAMDPCCLPRLPVHTSGLLLIGCHGMEDLARWQTRLETLCRVPVLGGLCDSPSPTRSLAQASSERGDARPAPCEPNDIEVLGDDFMRHVRMGRLLNMARSAAPLPMDNPWQVWPDCQRRLRVAMAYDDAFNCYFPDTMDCLEAMGAELIDFSPLKSECLPEGIDLVWLGCGHPEQFPEHLSRNICLQQSLHAYTRAGGRVYAEGGGLAYVCETMQCESGTFPMAGVLPAEAHHVPTAPHAVDLKLVGNPWLGRRRVRGYLNPCWTITAHDQCVDYSAESKCPLSLVGSDRVIGSRIQLHFASQPQLLKSIWSLDRTTGAG